MANPLSRYANATLKVPIAGSGAAVQDADGNYIAPGQTTIDVKALLRPSNMPKTESTGVDQSATYLSGRLVDPNYLPFGVQYPLECECILKSGQGTITGKIQLEVRVQEGFAGRKVEDKIGQSIGGRFYVRGASDA